jgi:hypothetical protein
MLPATMASIGGLELILLAFLGFGPSMLLGVLLMLLASGAPTPHALHAPPGFGAEPPALHGAPPVARPAPSVQAPLVPNG